MCRSSKGHVGLVQELIAIRIKGFMKFLEIRFNPVDENPGCLKLRQVDAEEDGEVDVVEVNDPRPIGGDLLQIVRSSDYKAVAG